MSSRLHVALALSVSPAFALAGCFGNFDERLYMAAERDTGSLDGGALDAGARDGGLDAGLDAGSDAADAGLDAGLDAGADTGTDVGVDAAVPMLTLANFCNVAGSVPTIPRPASPSDAVSSAFLVDTTGLSDDFSDVAACTGSAEPGNDGFASLMMLAGERWHFHLRRPSGGANAALYVLSTCDERTCVPGGGQDLCGNSADEHFSFTAPTDGLYFLAVDAEQVGQGFTGELDVIHPVCGNGVREHSEGCDDGGTLPGGGCDARCRAELASGASEMEANDDLDSANHLLLAASGPTTVVGHVASACESDVFAFDVPAGETAAVTLSFALTTGGCPADASTPIDLAVLDANGIPLATASVGAGGGCPSLSGGALATLPAGEYYARVRSISSGPDRPIDYRLSLTAALTP